MKLLKVWNKLNEPPLNNGEIETLLRSALQGNYQYGCSDSILKSVCKSEGCPFARAEKRELTLEEKTKSELLLRDENLLEYMLSLGKKRLIGEDNLLKQNFIFLVSGQTHYPISEIITGHSGSGKNESIRAITPLIPENWVFEFTTSTPEAIKYLPKDFCGTIIIYELDGIRSETGTLGLRLYDLFDESDAMIIQSVSGVPLTEEQVKKALSLLIENMSEDGQPLIWQVYDGSLFLAINRKAAPFGLAAYKQYKSLLSADDLERIFDEATIRRFEKKIQKKQSYRDRRPKDFDFGGILPRHVIEGKKAVSLRKSVEALLDEVKQMSNLQSDYPNWVRDCIIALEPIIRDDPFVRDTDLEELVDTLYDDLMMADEMDSKFETVHQDKTIAEFSDYMDRLHQTIEKVFSVMKTDKGMIIRASPFTMQDVVRALKTVQPIADSFYIC